VLSVFDGWVTRENTVQSFDEAIAGAKAIVIVTEYSDIIEKLSDLDISSSTIEVIVDGRNCLDVEVYKSQGVLFREIGR
jgi:UDP-glucose 6-dehydrogenase